MEDQQWMKILALFMRKQGVTQFEISPEDVKAMPPGQALIGHVHRDSMTVLFMTEGEAQQYVEAAQQKGGHVA